ncbi:MULTISPECIES: RbsD/FucU family protein [unclassified Paenibacillus]|uniref:RbsD/FucU family protein n=1 Tax=unclassified Paenibacillus TaxID=185978 RepID=UPI00070F31A1|nr:MULTISPECIES: RbsD/FucU domain-containing protein [unclassified Paenibacillus]KQX62661.1 fucose isomerase [Paenibacillus sp. Root444D2]KRE46371.1 fucose isomerase [Paenibacillus sp. Soil724D2]
MLKGIPSLISPEMLKILMEMGHGDELVLGDGNFPAASCAKRLVRADGHGISAFLEAVLKLFPLDTSADAVTVMQVDPGDPVVPGIWEDYKQIVQRAANQPVPIVALERSAFYERCRNAYAVVATGESALYANVMIRKGIVTSDDQ